MKKNGEAYRSFSYVVLARVISAGIQAIFYLIFASILEPEGYGEMSYLIAIAGTLSVISRFGLPFSVEIYQSKANVDFANQANLLFVIITGVMAIVLLLFNPFIAFLAFATSFFFMNQYNLLGLKQYKRQMWMSIGKSSLILVCPLLLYFVFEIPGIILGMAISNILFGFTFIKSIKKKELPRLLLKKNFKVLVHNFGADASSNLSRILDKLIIVPVLGFTVAGIYQLNLQILFGLEIIPIALHSFLLSEGSNGHKQKKITNLVIIFSGIITVLVIILTPVLIPQLFPKYTEGVLGLQIMSLSLVPLTISWIYLAKLQAIESTKIGYSAIIRIGSLLILIILLGDWYGIEGISMAMLFSVIFNLVFLSVLYQHTKR